MMEKIVFSRPLSEVGCIIGHLFHGMEPPCDATRCGEDWLTICFSEEGTMRHHYLGTGICSTELDIEGPTKGGGSAKLKIKRDTCEFYGDPAELQAILDGRCPDRRCGHA